MSDWHRNMYVSKPWKQTMQSCFKVSKLSVSFNHNLILYQWKRNASFYYNLDIVHKQKWIEKHKYSWFEKLRTLTQERGIMFKSGTWDLSVRLSRGYGCLVMQLNVVFNGSVTLSCQLMFTWIVHRWVNISRTHINSCFCDVFLYIACQNDKR